MSWRFLLSLSVLKILELRKSVGYVDLNDITPVHCQGTRAKIFSLFVLFCLGQLYYCKPRWCSHSTKHNIIIIKHNILNCLFWCSLVIFTGTKSCKLFPQNAPKFKLFCCTEKIQRGRPTLVHPTRMPLTNLESTASYELCKQHCGNCLDLKLGTFLS